MLIVNLAMALTSIVSPTQTGSIVGDFSSVLCGEIDPIVIGDACVATLVSASGQAFGLVADIESFSDEDYIALQSLRGTRIRLEEAEIRRIDDPETLEALLAFGREPLPYFRWTGRWDDVE